MAGTKQVQKMVRDLIGKGGTVEFILLKDENGWILDPPFAKVTVGHDVVKVLREIATIIQADLTKKPRDLVVPRRRVTQAEWDDLHQKRTSELDRMMPGGLQGANVDMTDVVVEGEED